jgi:DNA-binding GntR family transcriptional regulator
LLNTLTREHSTSQQSLRYAPGRKKGAAIATTLADDSGVDRNLAGLPSLPPRPSTAEHAASVLREQISAGRLQPGTRLREEQVAESFAISRNTVREVFRLLAHERLVDHVAYRGVHVRRMSADDIRAMYVTRRLVEPLGLAAALRDPEVRSAMREAVDTASAAAERQEWEQVGTGDIAFHRTLVDGCRSVHLSGMFEQLLAELRLAFLLLPDRQLLHRPYLARNRRLTDLVEAGEAAAAFDELADYLQSSERDVLQAIES